MEKQAVVYRIDSTPGDVIEYSGFFESRTCPRLKHAYDKAAISNAWTAGVHSAF